LDVFQKQLNQIGIRDRLSLKYCRRTVNGTPSWAGLRAAKGFADVWRYLLANGSDMVEVGVSIEDMEENEPIDGAQWPMIGTHGTVVVAYFYKSNNKRWVGKPGNAISLPHTYQVCPVAPLYLELGLY